MRRFRLLILALVLGCNDGLQPTTICDPHLVGICGHITFRGAVPDSTDVMYLVAYGSFPQTENDLFNFLPFPPAPRQSP